GLSVCFSLSVTNLSQSKFYLISLSQSNFQFLRQTRTYFGNLALRILPNFSTILLENRQVF
ncbi:hypothetical protein, partial [Streptococcus suis]|uniref:hypothetical protein n=1 Tax=Streptococcus suis TaxID=1307 RepID=UPI001C98C69B